MKRGPARPSHFAFHAHVQLVRGRVGAVVHNLFEERLYWFRDPAVAEALAGLSRGDAAHVAGKRAGLSIRQVEGHIDALCRLGLGIRVDRPYASELYRPTLLRSQARLHSIWPQGGTVTMEIADSCVYRCPWCTGGEWFAPVACACGVWRDGAEALPVATAVSALDQLVSVGVRRLVVLGGDPWLAPEWLWALLGRASKLGIRSEVHTTGILLRDADVVRLRTLPVELVITIPSRDEAVFDRLASRNGAWTAMRRASETLRLAGVRFSAKVLARAGSEEETEQTVAWARSLGAQDVRFIACQSNEQPVVRSTFGPQTPQDMAVGLEEFLRNGQGQGCLENSYFIARSGILTRCIAHRAPLADLKRVDMGTILREERLPNPLELARHRTSGCGGCEFRMGCEACLVRTEEATGSPQARHWNCRYDPDTAAWAP